MSAPTPVLSEEPDSRFASDPGTAAARKQDEGDCPEQGNQLDRTAEHRSKGWVRQLEVEKNGQQENMRLLEEELMGQFEEQLEK